MIEMDLNLMRLNYHLHVLFFVLLHCKYLHLLQRYNIVSAMSIIEQVTICKLLLKVIFLAIIIMVSNI